MFHASFDTCSVNLGFSPGFGVQWSSIVCTHDYNHKLNAPRIVRSVLTVCPEIPARTPETPNPKPSAAPCQYPVADCHGRTPPGRGGLFKVISKGFYASCKCWAPVACASGWQPGATFAVPICRKESWDPIVEKLGTYMCLTCPASSSPMR